MITDEKLRQAATKSTLSFVDFIEQEYTTEEQHTFSPSFEKKINKLKRKAKHPYFYHSLKYIAAAILIIFIGLGTWLTMDVDARTPFFNWIKEIRDNYLVYHSFYDSEMPSSIDTYELLSIPDGYRESSGYISDSSSGITYRNDSGQFIQFQRFYGANPSDISFYIKDGTIKTTSISKYEANLIIFEDKSSTNSLIWIDENNCLCRISSSLGEDDLIKLANSVYDE